MIDFFDPNDLVEEQLSVTTADEERNYFARPDMLSEQTWSHPGIAPGVYRVVDNVLYRIVPGFPIGVKENRDSE